MNLGTVYPALQKFALFAYFQTREDYQQRTGWTCPPFDPSLPVKGWEDRSAFTGPGPRITYQRVISFDHGNPVAMADGEVITEPLTLDRAFAARVNIPEHGIARWNEPGADGEVPMPLNDLPAGVRLELRAFGGVGYSGDGAINPAADSTEAVALKRIEAKLDNILGMLKPKS